VKALSRKREKKTSFSSMLKCMDFQKAHNSKQWTKIFHHQVYITRDLSLFSLQTCRKSRGRVSLICWLCPKGYVEYKYTACLPSSLQNQIVNKLPSTKHNVGCFWISRNLRALKSLPFHILQPKSTAQVARCTKPKVLWFWYL
jgi:hypothetical protein